MGSESSPRPTKQGDESLEETRKRRRIQEVPVRQEDSHGDTDNGGEVGEKAQGQHQVTAPVIQGADQGQTDNRRKKRKECWDRDTTVTNNTKLKALTVKQMLERMNVTGKKKLQIQSDTNDIGGGRLNIVSQNIKISGGNNVNLKDKISAKNMKAGSKVLTILFQLRQTNYSTERISNWDLHSFLWCKQK